MIAFIPFIIFAITNTSLNEKKKFFLITLVFTILILSIGVKSAEVKKAIAQETCESAISQ